jgi:uncharacterized DUF497 family protein
VRGEFEASVRTEFFEWDDAKAEANLRKHRVNFLEAETVFGDPFVRIELDSDHSEGEVRSKATGLSAGSRVLLVVYTERRERIRIVSARKATRQERREYESQFGQWQ